MNPRSDLVRTNILVSSTFFERVRSFSDRESISYSQLLREGTGFLRAQSRCKEVDRGGNKTHLLTLFLTEKQRSLISKVAVNRRLSGSAVVRFVLDSCVRHYESNKLC